MEFVVVEVAVTVVETPSCCTELPRVTEVDDSMTEDETRKFWLSICTVTSRKAIISLLALLDRSLGSTGP